MRDATILMEQARTRAIVDNNTLSMAQQFSTVVAHQSALEHVLFGSRFAPIKLAFLILFRGGEYISKRIYEEQQETLRQMKKYAQGLADEKSKEIVKPNALGVLKI